MKKKATFTMIALLCSTLIFASGMDALSRARSYLKYSSFSAEGLKEQLAYEGFSDSDASYAVDNCNADWNEQAVLKAENYLRYSSFSKQGLIEQLEYEGFTPEQARYGAEQAFQDSSDNPDNTDWNKQAVNKAKSYLRHSSFSKAGLIRQLEYEGFTESQARYGAENCGADWNEQAAKKAKSYMRHSSFSRQSLIRQLLYEGFTESQAQYGVSNYSRF